ncbi:MAG: hypothetical protein NC483_07885, partial [Ruminococcus sp.]|nr:hypothetical protein [Ruminococcus sp.]
DLEAFKDREAYELGTNDGISLGKEEGIIEGRKKEKVEIATSMLKEKCDITLINKVTNLNIKEIEEISQSLKSE